MRIWYIGIVSLILLALGSTGCRCCRSDFDYDYPLLDCCRRCDSCDGCDATCEPVCEPLCEPVCEPACEPVCEPGCEPTCEVGCAPGCDDRCGGYVACDHCNQGRDRCRKARVCRNGRCCIGLRGLLAWIFCIGEGCGNCCDNAPCCPPERAGSIAAPMMYPPSGSYYEPSAPAAPVPMPASYRRR